MTWMPNIDREAAANFLLPKLLLVFPLSLFVCFSIYFSFLSISSFILCTPISSSLFLLFSPLTFFVSLFPSCSFFHCVTFYISDSLSLFNYLPLWFTSLTASLSLSVLKSFSLHFSFLSFFVHTFSLSLSCSLLLHSLYLSLTLLFFLSFSSIKCH